MLQVPASQSCHHNPLTQPTSQQLCDHTHTSAGLSQHDTRRQSVHHYVDTGAHASCNIDPAMGAASQQDAFEVGVVGASEPASQLLCDTAMELCGAEVSVPASPGHASGVCEPSNGTEAERALRELEDFCKSEAPDCPQDVLCFAAASAPLHRLWKPVRTLLDCPDAPLPCHSSTLWSPAAAAVVSDGLQYLTGNVPGVALDVQGME